MYKVFIKIDYKTLDDKYLFKTEGKFRDSKH